METLFNKAIQSIKESKVSFSKFITANDTGSTGAHQAGYHIHKHAWMIGFETEGIKGDNKDSFVTIKWQDDFETESRFIYYGVGTRNEYRLTRFGRGFPFLNDESIGNLLILCKYDESYYKAFVLSTDEDIENFLIELNVSASDINGIIPRQFDLNPHYTLTQCFNKFIESLKIDFPETTLLAKTARDCFNLSNKITSQLVKKEPDKIILDWLNVEFQLFKTIENLRYSSIIKEPFKSVEELVDFANTILNRRKSRAGKSLEHHLSEIFNQNELSYSKQAISEENKKPDFLFPSEKLYNDLKFDSRKLTFLASKTTCKDRWRQVLNEADRIKTKHLFTLQQGISKNQLKEMYRYDVCLVVPQPYIKSFPEEYREKIMSLEGFVKMVSKKSI